MEVAALADKTLSQQSVCYLAYECNFGKGEMTMLLESIKYALSWVRSSEKGVTTVEYAIMLALVAIAVAAATPGISSAVVSVFAQAAGEMAQ
jgi:Flp pilus assembly pilin Flp